jgi:carbonic anhydrase
MKNLPNSIPLTCALLATGAAYLWAQEKGAGIVTKELQQAATVKEIIAEMEEGNARFVAGKPAEHDFPTQVRLTATGQSPMGIVLACIDSRVLPEIIFDVDIGDLFDSRIAGNVVNEDIAGSMEYACAKAGSKLVLVLGHTNCGAVKGAIDGVKLGNLTGLLEKIQPAIDAVKDIPGERTTKNKAFVDAVVLKNVELTIGRVRELSPVLAGMEKEGKIKIEGGVYDVATGLVTFLPEPPPKPETSSPR